MRSMTGYGHGEASANGVKVTVELNSVNRKQSDISILLPKELAELEPRIRDEINAVLSRGKINVVVTWHRSAGGVSERVQLDEALARAYVGAIRRLQRRLGLSGEVTVETILRAPGVLQLRETDVDAGRLWPLVETALRRALAGVVRMREREGKHLATDLAKRLRWMEREVAGIRKLAPQMVQRYREQLQARIAAAGVPVPLDDERLTREVVFYADRCDIAEELTRLQSHFAQFREALRRNEPVGRTLDFLTQEMNREINTIGSKANAAEISRRVVQVKAELEKIREQVQNIE